jgi:hypothetical protein
MQQKYSDETLCKWISNSQKIGSDLTADIFCIYLESTIKNNWKGACHDLSASFHMSLLEYGIESKLCIGVASMGIDIFDHSWVEIGGKYYDFAICNQIEKSFPPVFSSINLDSNKPSQVAYGIPSAELDEPAKSISELTMNGYQKIRPDNHFSIFKIAAELGSAVPHRERKMLNESVLEKKYSDLRRMRR